MANFFDKYSGKILTGLIFLYISALVFFSLKKYYTFNYNIFDLAIFNQVFYNTVSGQWFEMTFNLHNYLADHFSPVIFLLAPIYWLWQAPQNLLIIQTIFLGLSAWPIYLISQKVIGKNIISLMIATAWLVNFILHNGNLYEFHLISLAVFFILWSFYFYYRNNFGKFLIFFILAILTREDIILVFLGFSILASIEHRNYKWRLTPLVGIIYFILAIQIISLFNNGEVNKFLLYYSWLGGDSWLSILWLWLTNPVEFLRHLFSLKNLFNSFIILASVSVLPLLAPRYLWLAFFPFLQFLLTADGLNNIVYGTHYGLIFLPALFIASIFSVSKILSGENFWAGRIIFKDFKFFVFLSVFTIIYFSVFLSPVKDIIFDLNKTPIDLDKSTVIKEIPKEASLVVSAGLAPALSSRTDIYPFQYSYMGRGQFYLTDFIFPDVDYILVDMDDVFLTLAYTRQSVDAFSNNFSQKIPDDFRNRLKDYQLVLTKNDLLLWQNKKFASDGNDLLLYEFEDVGSTDDQSEIWFETHYSSDKQDNLLNILYKPKLLPVRDNYLVRFYANDYYFDVPIDYGLYPPRDWPKDKLASFYYHLSKDIKFYQIFSWNGEVALGKYRQAEINFDLEPLTAMLDINPVVR